MYHTSFQPANPNSPMIARLILVAYLVASLSASDAYPGQTIRVAAGCDAGLVRVEPQQGITVGPTRGEGLAQWADLRIAPDAWPGVRHIVVTCGDAQTRLAFQVRGARAVVFVPVAQRSPGG